MFIQNFNTFECLQSRITCAISKSELKEFGLAATVKASFAVKSESNKT